MHGKVAFLGPEGSFSSQVARKYFPGWDTVPFEDFEDIIESVIHRESDAGITPFENSNSKSIVELQIAVAARRCQVYITDLVPHHIEHCLFSNCQLLQIQEVRSKDVVFAQTHIWLSENLPNAKRSDYPSTSAAVRSLLEDEAAFSSAIASRDSLLYGVPIVAEGIQTEPNITIFCRIEKVLADLSSLTSMLVALKDFAESNFRTMNDIVISCGCAVTSNWVLNSYPHRIAIFEITKVAENSDLPSASSQIERRLKNSFLMGGYARKTITELISEKHINTP